MRIAYNHLGNSGLGPARALTIILVVLWVAAVGQRDWSMGLGLLLGGLWIMTSGPVVVLPKIVWLLAGIWFLASMACFLPAAFGLPAEWREGLSQAGISLSDRITPQPAVALHAWLGQLLAGVVLLRILALPDLGERRVSLAVGLLAAIVAYVVLAWLRWRGNDGLPGAPHFGFFPNRNHGATLLAMGAMLATGLLLQSARRKAPWLLAFALGSLAVLIWVLVFVNISRAGIVLLVGGLFAIRFLSGGGYLRGNAAKVLALSVLGALVVLFVPHSQVKQRFSEKALGLTVEADGQLDARIAIFSDTLEMIGGQPLVGWGAGHFADLFPQYTKLSAPIGNARHLHPESSWLWMAAEAGIPAALALFGLAAVVVAAGARGARRGPDRALRCGCVVAGALPLVHAFVDVPLHRESLLWLAGLLFALSGPFSGHRAGVVGVWCWRFAGGVVLSFGIAVLHGEWSGRPLSPSRQAETRFEMARRLVEFELVRSGDGGMQSEIFPEGDPLEAAMRELDNALAIQPMDERLHGLHGMLALHFDDKDDRAKADFKRQALLAPRWVRLPLIQAEAWKDIRAEESIRLWGIAMERAKDRPKELSAVFDEMLRSAAGRPELEDGCLRLAGTDRRLVEETCRRISGASLIRLAPQIRAALARGAGSSSLNVLDERLKRLCD